MPHKLNETIRERLQRQKVSVPPDVAEPNPVKGGATLKREPFSVRNPRLAGFLRNLGPALAALELPDRGLQPFPTSGLEGVLRGLAAGGRTFVGASENIRQDQQRRQLESSPVYRNAQAKIQAGQLEQLTPGELYVLQRLQGAAPQTFLGGAEQAQAQRFAGKLGVTPTEERGFVLQEKGVEVQASAVEQRRQEAEKEHEARLKGLGVEEKRINELARENDIRQSALIDDIVTKYAPADAAQRRAIRNYANSIVFGTRLSATDRDLLDEIPAVSQIEAETRQAAVDTKQGEFVRLGEELIRRRFSSRGEIVPGELQSAFTILARKDFHQLLASDDPETAEESLETWNKYFPVEGGSQGWLSQLLPFAFGGAERVKAIKEVEAGGEGGPGETSVQGAQQNAARAKVQRLRAIPNRTPEQEKELRDALRDLGLL